MINTLNYKGKLIIKVGSIEGYIDLTGEVCLSRVLQNGETTVEGKGRGDLQAFRCVWGCLLSWAKRHGLKKLWCEPTVTDGRGVIRTRVYTRVGFTVIQKSDNYIYMELSL